MAEKMDDQVQVSARLAVREQVLAAELRLRRQLREVRDKLDSLEDRLDRGMTLNPLGELQQSGPQLDAAVAELAASRAALRLVERVVG